MLVCGTKKANQTKGGKTRRVRGTSKQWRKTCQRRRKSKYFRLVKNTTNSLNKGGSKAVYKRSVDTSQPCLTFVSIGFPLTSCLLLPCPYSMLAFLQRLGHISGRKIAIIPMHFQPPKKMSFPHVVNDAAQPEFELHVLPRGDCIFLRGRHGGGGVRIAVSGRLMAAITRVSFHVSSKRVCLLKFSYAGFYFHFLSCYFPTSWAHDVAVEDATTFMK